MEKLLKIKKKDTLPMRPLMIHVCLTEINAGLLRMCLKQESGQTHFYEYVELILLKLNASI